MKKKTFDQKVSLDVIFIFFIFQLKTRRTNFSIFLRNFNNGFGDRPTKK